MILTNQRSLIVFMLIWSSIFHSFQVAAQRPPTGGSAPPPIQSEEDNGISPIVFIVGGLALGAATYVLVKPKGVKIPVSQHLPNYLLANNILPNQDALELMYELNPELKDMPEIRSKKKLTLPDFPILDENIPPENPALASSETSLKFNNEVELFNSSKETFTQLELADNSNESIINMEKVQALINQVGQELNAIGNPNDPSYAMLGEFMNDLLSVFNQTIIEINEEKTVNPAQLSLLQNIVDNLAELISDSALLSYQHLDNSVLSQPKSLDKTRFLASTNPHNNQVENPFSKRKFVADTKDFAFAVYKYSEEGELITKGPEVENKYFISYVVPALKDFSDYYKPILNPATYAIASLPPAVMYIEVKDINGNVVSINNPKIDFKSVYEDPHELNENKMIKVPLFIKP